MERCPDCADTYKLHNINTGHGPIQRPWCSCPYPVCRECGAVALQPVPAAVAAEFQRPMTKLVCASIVTAFDTYVVGSKVTSKGEFLRVAVQAIEAHDFTTDRVPGQGFLVVPDAIPFVSAGDGFRTEDPSDYVPVLHRGEVQLCLRRVKAGPVRSVALIVYTREAYLADPEVDTEERERVALATHVLVAVLASSGPNGPLTPGRLVANLAGGNNEALAWTADEIRATAAASNNYWTRYAVVAG